MQLVSIFILIFQEYSEMHQASQTTNITSDKQSEARDYSVTLI